MPTQHNRYHARGFGPMPTLRRALWIVICFYVVLAGAQDGKRDMLADALLQARTPLILTKEGLSGNGAEVLSKAIASSRFVLLGEDHFSREIPELASAMCDIIHPDAYVVEAGPDAARFVDDLLTKPDRISAMERRERMHPENMAFLSIREENDLAAHCAQSSRNPHFQLWGLDQEFIGAAGMILDAMAAANPGPQSRKAIALAQAQERGAEKRARQSGKVEELFLLASTDADVQPLRDAISTDGNDATKHFLAEFLASRHIYQMHLQGLSDSNKVRAQLLKQHFMTDYIQFKKQTADPRIFIKFGGMHTGKGFSFLHQRDLGNFIAEQADLEGTQSLHIFALGIRGVHSYPSGYGKAILPQPFDLTTDHEWSWLAPALTQSLPEDGVASNTLTLYDLRQLRFRHLNLPGEWEHVVYSYDLLILIPNFTAATPIQ